MGKIVLVKPILTEKADSLSEKLNQYTFIVDRKVNKLEVKKAVEEMYNVAVDAVNTTVIPGKVKNRNTKTGVVRGRKAAYKKAIVTLAKGEEIDLFGNI